MTVMRADIALLTERRYESSDIATDDWYRRNILQDDGLLQRALARRGLSSVRVDWARADVDWSLFRVAVFRSTWDYFDRIAEFDAWLAANETATRWCNNIDLVRWNMDKHYLLDLAEHGVPVVPSRFLERGNSASLASLMHEADWTEAVIKPCISGAARHTYRLNHRNIAAVEPVVQELLRSEALILQPFQQDVLQNGEDTLVILNGAYSHAVRKLPKAGDFRVQDDHGGSVHQYQPTVAQIELALQAMNACCDRPAYGRVDMVCDASGNSIVMELELIEPELWLRHCPESANLFADAIAGRI